MPLIIPTILMTLVKVKVMGIEVKLKKVTKIASKLFSKYSHVISITK